MRITLTDYWMGRDQAHPPSKETRQNAMDLLVLVDELLDEAEADRVPLDRRDQITGTLVSSGYRPPAVNERTANAAKRSTHLTGEGIDIQDNVNQDLARWCLRNLDVLERLGLHMEDPRWTYSHRGDHWVHLQSRPPRSGRRVFVPSAAPPRGPALL